MTKMITLLRINQVAGMDRSYYLEMANRHLHPNPHHHPLLRRVDLSWQDFMKLQYRVELCVRLLRDK